MTSLFNLFRKQDSFSYSSKNGVAANLYHEVLMLNLQQGYGIDVAIEEANKASAAFLNTFSGE